MKYRKVAFILIIISVINLSVMIPGGPVDTRMLSSYSPLVLASFNIFLTLLGVVSILTPFYILKNYRWALIITFISGFSYFLVYTFDLLQIFPKSPDQFPILLLVLEIIGSIISIPLMLFSYLSLRQNDMIRINRIQWNTKKIIIMIALIILGLCIIIFSTISAINS